MKSVTGHSPSLFHQRLMPQGLASLSLDFSLRYRPAMTRVIHDFLELRAVLSTVEGFMRISARTV